MTAFTATPTDLAGATDGPGRILAAGVTTDSAGAADDVSFTITSGPVVVVTDSAGLTDGARALFAAGTTTDRAGTTDAVSVLLTTGGGLLTQVLTDRAGSTDAGSGVDFLEGLTDAAGGVSTMVPLYVPSSAPSTLISALIDWGKDGSFVTASQDDVTTDVRGAVTASYGREGGTSLSLIVAGRGSFDLDNRSRTYSPRNASSPLFGKLKPARPVLLTRTVAGTVYTIFRGHTDDGPINPDLSSRTVSLNLVDNLADFRGVQISTDLYSGIRTGTAIGLVLDAVGWTGGRMIDVGATTIPWWWCQAADAYDMLSQLVASEGPPALLTIDASGAVVFRDRHHRLRSTASTTSQATFAGLDTSPEPRMGTGFTYDEAWANVVNTVSISVDERVPSPDLVQVWSTDETIAIAPLQSYTVVIATSDPFYGAVPPVAGTDYVLGSGAVTAAVLTRTSGASTSITLTADTGGAQIVGLALRARSVPVTRTRVVTASDAPSQLDYGQKGLPSGAEPVWASYPDAQSLASLWVATRKDPLPVLNVRFIAQHTMTARLAAILTRNLSDRVTVVEPETSTNGPFFVESISHTVNNLTAHEVVFGVEAVPAAASSVFLLGTSLIGGPDPLGY